MVGVRAKKAQPNHKPQAQMQPAQVYTFPAPTKGLVLNDNITTPQPGAARVLDNWICGTNSIRVRGGFNKYATVASSAAVVSMFSYRAGGTEKLFAAVAASVYDITTVADVDTIPTAVFTDQTSGYYSTVNFGTTSGNYLYAVNGDDLPWIFDGTDWNPVNAAAVNEIAYDALSAAFTAGETLTGGTSGATATILAVIPATATTGTLKLGAITSGPYQDNEALTSAGGSATANGASAAASTAAITGVTTSTLSHVWVYASRIWFVEGGTMNAWYLPVDSIGGAANSVSLAGVFKKGGSLLFGATWSIDAGDGLDDKCVFVSTEGEVAVYAGIDPSSSTTWALQGVYEISRPLGKNATMKAGGDLLIATEVGLAPLSEAIKRDVGALSMGAVSRRIEPYWQEQAARYLTDALPWEIQRWDSEGIMLVSLPRTTAGDSVMMVASLQTGAWSRFTGMDVRTIAQYDGYVYFGSLDGFVYRLQETGANDGTPYTCKYLGQHENLGTPIEKTVAQMRPMFSSNIPIAPQATVLVNYSETLSSAPNAYAYSGTEGWDISVWDTSLWDASAGTVTSASDSQWVAIGRTGHVAAPEIQITIGGTALPEVELLGVDATWRPGAMVA